MLRFKKNNATDFPNLEETTLGEVCNKIGDGLHSAPTYDVDGEYYFINGNNLKDGTIIITSDTKKVSKETFLKNDKGLDGHTILLSINGTIGNLAYYKNENVMLGKSAAYLKIKKSVDKEYIYQLLQTRKVKTSFLLSLTGTTIKNLGLEAINKTHIFIPVLEEQHKIADFLSSVDEIIRVQEEEITVLEEQKKGIMQKLFNCEVRFKADDGSEYPEWEKKKLIDVCKYVDYRGKTPEKTDGGVFLVTAKNVRQGYIDYDISQEYVSEYKYDEIMYRGKPKIGDVIITTEAPCGFVAQIDREDIALAQRIIKYRGKEKIVYNAYLKYALLSEEFQKMLLQKSTGGTVKGIKGSVLHTLKIKLPCLVEQQKIADCLSAYDEVIQIKKDKLEVWKKIKKGLLQQMFV